MPGPGRLALADRDEITIGLHTGQSFTAIAARLGKAVSTVSRELAANGGREAYRAWRAHRRARGQARRPKAPKLACPQLAAQVAIWLEEWWSPVQISRRLRSGFPGDPMMRVSHETIYQSLYVQGRGELRPTGLLPAHRAGQTPLPRPPSTAQIRDMVMISERPAEASDRAVPGHGEGDLIIGGNLKSPAGTLADRTTRYVLLLHLPGGRDAHLAEQAMRQAITALPAELARTITWDQGKEMAYHAGFTIATGIRSTSATRTSPGSAAPTRTPTGCCASTCPKAPTYPCIPRSSPSSLRTPVELAVSHIK